MRTSLFPTLFFFFFLLEFHSTNIDVIGRAIKKLGSSRSEKPSSDFKHNKNGFIVANNYLCDMCCNEKLLILGGTTDLA